MNPLDGPDYAYSALNGLTRDADGKITYNFDGRVKARGLDLDAGLGGQIATQNRIRWIYGPNGEAIADDAAYEQVGGGFARYMSLGDEDPLSSSGVGLFMFENGGGLQNAINITATDAAGAGPLHTLLDATGHSAYVQAGDIQGLGDRHTYQIQWDATSAPPDEYLDFYVDAVHVVRILVNGARPRVI